MHNYQEKDFSGCVFNPLIKKDLIKAYPGIQTIIKDNYPKELTDKVLRYVISMYDQSSPLIRALPELTQRKQVAANIAEITDEKFLDSLFKSGEDWVVEIVGSFLRNFGAPKVWMMIVSQEQMFHEYFDRIMKPVDADKDTDIIRGVDLKSKLAAEMDTISQRLEGYYRKLYGEDDDLQAQSKQQRLTPEQIAARIKNVRQN